MTCKKIFGLCFCQFPAAYEKYYEECNTPPSLFHQRSLLGKCLLIPPQLSDISKGSDDGYWIACLFTSLGYGRSVSSADVILESTMKAMADLGKRIQFLRGNGHEVGELWAVRINSGKFGVNWERTKRVLEQCRMDVKIMRPKDKDNAPVGGVIKKRIALQAGGAPGPKPSISSKQKSMKSSASLERKRTSEVEEGSDEILEIEQHPACLRYLHQSTFSEDRSEKLKAGKKRRKEV